MMADPNFNIGPKPLDIGSLIEMARGAQRLQGESAMGDIYARATNPNGTMNTERLGSAENKQRAGVMAPQLATHTQMLTQGQQVIDKQKMDNLREWYKTLDQTVFPLVNDPELNHGKVLDAVHSLVGHKASMLNGGLFTPDMAIKTAQQFYGPDGQKLPPDQIRKKLGQFHTRVLGALEASESEPIGPDENGNMMHMTRAGAIARDAALPRGQGGAPQPGAMQRPPGGPVAQPSAPGQPVTSVQPGGGVATARTMPMGSEESTKVMQSDLARSRNYGQEITPWHEALKDVQALKDKGFSFGPGAKGRQDFQSFLYSLTPQLAAKYGVDPEKLRLFADAQKYLTQATLSRASQGLHGSDLQLATTVTGNPNVDINSMSIEDTVKMAIALRRMEHAQTLEASKAGGPRYTAEASRWPTSIDQRAFALDLMPAKDRDALLHSFKKGTPEYARFNKSLEAAHLSGVMLSPDAK
jgi:hypothetical protein